MGSFTSILADVGKGLKWFFSHAVPIAQAAEPFIDVVLPGIAPLYNTTVNLVADAEIKAIAAGSQNGTGAQKLAYVVAAVEEDFANYWQQSGHTTPATVTDIEKWVNAVVASLNAIPAAQTTPAPEVTAPVVAPVAANPVIPVTTVKL